MNFIEDVEKLAELKDKGVLTDDEFQQKKAEILARSYEASGQALSTPEPAARPGSLDTTEKLLIEQRVANDKPSTAIAYVLWFFTSIFGGHRFYLGRTGSAIAMLVLSVTILGLFITLPWALIDLFLIPGMAREKSDLLRDPLTLNAL